MARKTTKTAAPPTLTAEGKREMREELIDLQEKQSELYTKYQRDWDALEKRINQLEEELRGY